MAYSTASKTKGTRLMLINEVALGNCFDTTEKDLTLTCAPEGYQSVHGVKATDTQSSDFKVDGMSSHLTFVLPICFCLKMLSTFYVCCKYSIDYF